MARKQTPQQDTKAQFSHARNDRDSDCPGGHLPRNDPDLDLFVTDVQHARAKAILTAVIEGAKQAGFVRSEADDPRDRHQTLLARDGIWWRVAVRERTRQRRVDPPTEWGHQMTWTPCGELVFQLRGGHYGSDREWSDRRRKRLEEQVGDIVEGILARHAKALEDRKRRQEEELRRAELEKLRQADQARYERLLGLADDWWQARRLRLFLNAFERSMRDAGQFDAVDVESLAWARQKADQLDPLTRRS